MIELKPCPFCGGKAEIISMGNGKYSVSCGKGGCMANISWCSDAESAAKSWNNRASGWIPCSERLPEVWEDVLTANGFGDIMMAKIGGDGVWVASWNSSLLDWPPIYWMPLPEPPKDKEEHHES